MANYQPFFAGNSRSIAAPGVKPTSSPGNYQSFFGLKTIAQPTAQELTATHVRQAQQQKQQQDEQIRKQAEDTAKQKSSPMGRIKSAVAPVVSTAKGLATSAVNTAKLPLQAAKVVTAGNEADKQKASDNLKTTYQQSLVKPFVDTEQVAQKQAVKQFKHLAGPTSTGAERQSIISNQKTATQDPAFKQTIRQFKDLPGEAIIQAEKMRSQGAKTADIKNYLTTQQKAQQALTRQGAGEIAAVSSLAVGGGSLADTIGGKEIASRVIPTAVAGGAGSEGSVLATNPNATGKELSSAGAQGFIAGALLPLAGHYIGKGAGEVKGRVSLPIGKPDLTAEKLATGAAAHEKMNIGQTALKPLMDEKAKLQQLKVQHPGQPKVDEAISNVDKKIQDVQKTTVKEAEQSQKISDKNTAEAKKIDQQVELIKAKKADTGKLSNVDQVKLKQLADRKQELSGSLPAPKHSGAMAEAPPETVVHLPNQKIYAKATPDQIAHMTDEVKNIPSDSADLVHLSPLNNATQRGATEVPLEDLLQRSPNATKAITSVPRESVTPAETKTSGVASSIEAKAVEKKLTTGFEGKAGYDPITVKEQAAKATDLVKTDLEKAKRMANGDEPVPSDLRGAALITALEEHATRTKDISLLKDLANSPLVAETSRHAQELRLLAEREPSSAVAKIREVAEARRKAAESRIGKSINQEVKRNARVVNSHLPAVKAKDWESLISALKC